MKTLETKYIHSTHLISLALLQLAPVSLLPGTATDPTGHHIRHKTSSLSFCNGHTGIHRDKKEKNPNNSHCDKTGHYFSFNNKIFCRCCCHHLWRKGAKHSSHCVYHELITTGRLGTSLSQNTPPTPASSPTPFQLYVCAAGLAIEPMH